MPASPTHTKERGTLNFSKDVRLSGQSPARSFFRANCDRRKEPSVKKILILLVVLSLVGVAAAVLKGRAASPAR